MASNTKAFKYAQMAMELVKAGTSPDEALMTAKFAMALGGKSRAKAVKLPTAKAVITKKMTNEELQEKSIAKLQSFFSEKGQEFEVVEKWNRKYKIRFPNGETAVYLPYQVSDDEVRQVRKG